MFYQLLKTILRPLIKLLWVREIKGLENLPAQGPVVVAANHNSYLDFFILGALLPRRVYFLAGEVFFKKWWWYPLVKLTGQIKVERYNHSNKSQVVEQAVNLLKEGKVVGIFPEGTRSATGQLGPAFSGVAKIAALGQAVIVPVGISGAFAVWPRQKTLPKLKRIIKVKIGSTRSPLPITATEEKEQLATYTDNLMQDIKNLLN